MLIDTLRFGEMDVTEDKIIKFITGIYGFEHLSKYVYLKFDEESPFSFLQSVEEKALSFIVIQPFDFFKDYEFELPEPILEELEVSGENDIDIWCILSVKDKLEKATCNLLAPIVINIQKKIAKQVILHGTRYSTKQQLFVAPEPICPDVRSEG